MKVTRVFAFFVVLAGPLQGFAQQGVPVVGGWRMQDVAKVQNAGAVVSAAGFQTTGWYSATVPGTVLTTLVNEHVYPEPTYGENERPEIIPESLNKTSYWYRTEMAVPKSYAGRHVWLNFTGINYSAAVWVNGAQVGTMRGAFARGRFDITGNVKAGKTAVVAVLVSPQPHPGVAHEHTLRNGVGQNGGITAIDGPTFLSTIGWDWLDAVRDRDTGIWQPVMLEATGPVEIEEPLVTTDLPLPKTDSADVAVKAKVENVSDQTQTGVLKGSFAGVAFERAVEIPPHSSQIVSFDATDTPQLHIKSPKLWWPNGYGPQNLYTLHLSFVQNKTVSDAKDVSFGVRKITYGEGDAANLTISVNGVRVFIRGGDWGLDEALKRVPRARLDAQIRMHQMAGMNLIRNWVGQSTSEDFYELCDKYGILLWDEFFQPNPLDGPNPDDIATYVANAREKIVRFRNHPSIAVWCGRNEGPPPPEIDAALRKLMAELEPTRLYQPSSTDGRGVRSGGPYHWRTPREFFDVDTAFKTETGSMSVPTLESIHGMMPAKDWETINDDWAQHDFAKGAQGGDTYRGIVEARYGAVKNLADFTRKAQLMNYEAYRAMYEGREAKLFAPATGVITWMSSPAQPSFVWQLYHYDLEPNASLFAVQKACEPVHVQWDAATNAVEVVNETPAAVKGSVKATVYALDGAVVSTKEYAVEAKASAATSLGEVKAGAAVSFVRLELRDAAGALLSQNFYWLGAADAADDLTALDGMQQVKLDAKVLRMDADGKTLVRVTLRNPGKTVALMAHVQLRRKDGERVLPVFYSDNYVSLTGGEERTITMEADPNALHGEDALVVVDGWNTTVAAASAKGVAIETNVEALVESSPVTGLPVATTGLR
jgi:beta-galactosidase/beta-glucuronidase